MLNPGKSERRVEVPSAQRRTERMEDMVIRKMEPRDVEELLPIELASSLTPWSRQMFLDELAHPLASCFVVTVEDPAGPTVAGFICFRNVENESELLNLSVHPCYRSQGIGRRLMQFYLEHCAAEGIVKSHLEVSISNDPALRLYHFFSYEKTGLRKRYYQGKVDALLLTKRI